MAPGWPVPRSPAAAWLALLLAAAARLLTGAVLPAELILALAAGVTAGAAVLVTLGVPDRRIGPAGIAAALRHAGLAVESVRPAEVEARGSRPFAAVTALLPSLRSSLAGLGRVARSPVRLTLLFGGSALVTLAYIGGLAASVAAFGTSASIVQVGAVYLVASLIAAASPTPGGLGAIEAATIAGLTGIGISSGPAVSAVLIYRLATYWLPVLPGWYSWRLLQRMGYV